MSSVENLSLSIIWRERERVCVIGFWVWEEEEDGVKGHVALSQAVSESAV